MTGYGSAERSGLKVEVRSVNHRFLDLALKMPQSMMQHEMTLRNLIRERFGRGRFDVIISLSQEGGGEVRVNMRMAEDLRNALSSLQHELALEGAVTIETFAGFRELFLTESRAVDGASLIEAFEEALTLLEEMRRREGEAIHRDLAERLSRVSALTEQVDSFCPRIVEETQRRLRERLRALLSDVSFDDGRVLQEASIMAERSDVSEEITRLRSHLSQMGKVLNEAVPIGRKVEFILQEMNREVNTIASKASDYSIANLTVEMKAELEKMREQAQNVQ
jgi:uncharacterized protein (TIGR00255 family)